VNAVFELSYYYDAIGDLQKSAETCLRMKDYSTSVEGIANATLQAARMYRDNGDTEKSQELYHKAENSSYGWVAGMALWDEGYIAMGKGKYAEARDILSKPVTGKYADQAQVLLLSAMAVSYDRENNFEQTRKYAKLCFDQYDSLKFHLSKDSGIESQVGVVKSMLYWIDQWEKLPIPVLVQPKEFIRDFPAGDQPIMQQIGVYSKLPITITVESDNKKVEILSTSKKAERTAGFFLNYSQLRIPREDVKGTITIRSPQYPKWVEHVKIKVMIQKNSDGRYSPGKAIIN
jgi:tetratricopeptide (TPR) repeat protein